MVKAPSAISPELISCVGGCAWNLRGTYFRRCEHSLVIKLPYEAAACVEMSSSDVFLLSVRSLSRTVTYAATCELATFNQILIQLAP